MFITTYRCPKGILSLGGGGEAERHQFHLSNDKRHILGVFRTHAQKENDKVWEYP